MEKSHPYDRKDLRIKVESQDKSYYQVDEISPVIEMTTNYIIPYLKKG
jgi:hypothetical protein